MSAAQCGLTARAVALCPSAPTNLCICVPSLRPARASLRPSFFTKRTQTPIHITQAAADDWDAFPEEEMSVQDLKAVLRDTFWGTERGLAADSDTRAEVVELISQLEARNPTPSPTDALDKLSGTWKLAYTSNSELVALLALGRLPLITVGDVVQDVDAASRTVENRISLSAPFSSTSLTATASFDVRSPKLLAIEFREGAVATPQLLTDFELPDSVEVAGQRLDLGPLRAALAPLDGPLRSVLGALGSALSSVPDLRFPIGGPAPTTSWLLTTYLDDDLRISRGDGGSVFVLVKEPVAAQAALPPAGETAAAIAFPIEPDMVVVEEDDGGNGSNGAAAGNGSSAASTY